MHKPEVSNALPAGHLRLAISFYTVLSQILFQLCNVARVSVEGFLVLVYFFIFSSGTKCLLSMDGNVQIRRCLCYQNMDYSQWCVFDKRTSVLIAQNCMWPAHCVSCRPLVYAMVALVICVLLTMPYVSLIYLSLLLYVTARSAAQTTTVE